MLGTLLTLLGSISLIAYIIYKYLNGNESYWKKRNVHRLDASQFASVWERLTFKYPVHELENMQYKYFKSLGLKEGYCGLMEFRRPVFYVTDLELIKNIMVKDFDYFVNRRQIVTEKSDPNFHKMLLNAKDQEWKNLRSTLSPTFTTGKIRRMYTCFNDSSNKLSDFIKDATKESGTGSTELDFHDVFTRYTTDVISSAAFGLDSEAFKDANSPFCVNTKKFQDNFSGAKVFKLVFAIVWPKLLHVLRIPLFNAEASNFFADIVHKAIQHREKTGDKRDDFLQLLIESRNTTPTTEDVLENDDTKIVGKTEKVQMTEQLITAQSLLFFIAGFDTTESLLVFAAYELALNPEIQEKLHQELKNAGNLTYDVIMKLEYLDKVVSEALRRYPPAIRTERVATRTYKVPNSDVVIEKDIVAAVPLYAIHQDETYYPNPNVFDPERFSEENKAKRHPYAYMPFGVGPRNCIASRFALAEGKSAIAHLILNFKLEPGKKTQIPVKITKATMKPEGGLWLKIQPRN